MANQEIVLKGRKQWVDATRALAMLLVIFGHQAPWCFPFFVFTTPIKIPLFFAVTGYVFNPRSGNQKEFFYNWFSKLVFPYFCLVAIPSVFFSLYYGPKHFLDSICQMVSGESFWFMPCLIVAEVIWFYVLKLFKRVLHVSVIAVVISTCGFVLTKNDILSYAYINTAMVCQLYLLIGYIFKTFEEYLSRIKVGWIIGIAIIYILMCYSSTVLFEDLSFDVHTGEYYNIPYCLSLIFVGCFSVLLTARYIWTAPKWLVYIGQNTFVLYMWSGYTLLFFVVLAKLGISIPTGLIKSIIYTLWATIMCCVLSYFVNKWCPIIIGRKKTNK